MPSFTGSDLMTGIRNGQLNKREKEALSLVADGLTSKQIGLILGISVNTVNQHIFNSMYKLDARTRSHCVVKALKKGLI